MRPIHEIANEISQDWKNPYFGAVPYINAMKEIITIDSYFHFDSAESIVLYFLCNAQTWRGETARRIKLELNTILKTLNK